MRSSGAAAATCTRQGAFGGRPNTVEGYFSVLKRGLIGTFHHVSEAHLHRYLAEFDFRYNRRAALDINDSERHDQVLAAIGGKRLTYRRTRRERLNSANG